MGWPTPFILFFPDYYRRFIKVDNGDNRRWSTSSLSTFIKERRYRWWWVSRANDDDNPVVVVIKTHPKKSLALGANRMVGSRQGHAPIIIPLSMELASKLTNPLLHKITKCNISYRKLTTSYIIYRFFWSLSFRLTIYICIFINNVTRPIHHHNNRRPCETDAPHTRPSHIWRPHQFSPCKTPRALWQYRSSSASMASTFRKMLKSKCVNEIQQ